MHTFSVHQRKPPRPEPAWAVGAENLYKTRADDDGDKTSERLRKKKNPVHVWVDGHFSNLSKSIASEKSICCRGDNLITPALAFFVSEEEGVGVLGVSWNSAYSRTEK